jgi:hypothetical protein
MANPAPYVSSFSAAKLAAAAGNLNAVRQSLERQLTAAGIDLSPTRANLPPGDEGEMEAISRLISLARGHGFCVELTGNADFSVTLPSAVAMLQSGHHRDA